MSHIATNRVPGSALSAWTAAPELRPPQPIMPTRRMSEPAAWAVRESSRLPSVAAAATVADFFRKSRREVSGLSIGFIESLLVFVVTLREGTPMAWRERLVSRPGCWAVSITLHGPCSVKASSLTPWPVDWKPDNRGRLLACHRRCWAYRSHADQTSPALAFTEPTRKKCHQHWELPTVTNLCLQNSNPFRFR